MKRRNSIFSLLLPALLLLCSCNILAGERVIIPDDVFYYQPAASVFGAEAVWVNPAGLSRFNITGYQFMADQLDGQYGKSWGSVVHRHRLSIAYREIDNPGSTDFQEYVFAGGFPLGRAIQFGTSYRWFKDGPGIYRHRHFWNVGFSGGSGGPIRWGFVLANLNRGKIDGERTQMEERFSLSYRPIGPNLTLSADMFISTGTRLSNADYAYLAELTPKPGVIVNALLDNDRNFQIGFRINFQKYFAGSKSRFARGGSTRGSTAFIGATSLRQPSVVPYPRRRLNLSVSGRPPENPPRPLFGRRQTSFLHYLSAIYRAAEDANIAELRLDLNRATLGFAQAQELREAIRYFRSRGKSVTCHLRSPNNLSYYIASAANKVAIPPVSQLRLVGLRAELTFYAGTLEKLGVNLDMVRIGKYKTAAESFTRTASSEENKEQINRLLDRLYHQFVTDIASGRGLSADSVRRIIDNGPFTSEEALRYGLVDALSYADDDSGILRSDYARISFRRYASDTLLNNDWRVKPVIAIVVAEGEIGAAAGGFPFGSSNGVTPGLMKSAFRAASDNPDTRAVILRLNSPGGSALAGEEIHRMVAKAAAKKPLVVSMGNVAASGAYYIATPARRIFASPATVTGSIGIFGGKADFSELHKKIGLGKELYIRGHFAGMLSTIRPFTDEERKKYFSHLNAFYQHFLSLVSESRQLPTDSVDALGRGRVWTGGEAINNGLVDELGGLRQSIDYAAHIAGLKDYDIRIYPQKRPLFVIPGWSIIRSVASVFGLGGNSGESTAGSLLYDEADNMYTRMPFDIDLK